MSEVKNDNKQYTAADISKYLEGKLNPSEMHAIEKAALEDSFLSDAIEGIREASDTYGSKSIHTNLEQLKEQIAVKVTGGRTIPLTNRRWWSVAAAACVLVVSTVLIYNSWFRNQQTDTIALVEPTNNLPETIGPASPENSISKRDTSNGINKESKDDSRKAKDANKANGINNQEEEKRSETVSSNLSTQEEPKLNLPPIKQLEKAKDIARAEAPKADDQNKSVKTAS
ncbi:MAG: hypothetical protein ACKVOW_14085, partial [Chitinophagaceae bacterium]